MISNWAINDLKFSSSEKETLRALEYLEYHDHLGFLKTMENFSFSDFVRQGSIGELVDENHDRFPYLASALNATTAMSCYFREPHPSAVNDFMNNYIGLSQYRSETVIKHFFKNNKHQLLFLDEDYYQLNSNTRSYQEADQYPIKEVLQVLVDYDVYIAEISFYGLYIDVLPAVIYKFFFDTKINFINCQLRCPLRGLKNYKIIET